jgi:hypothetical protein
VLEHLEKQLEVQSLVEVGERRYDLMRCSDGTELWFDIAMPFARLAGQFGPRASEHPRPWWRRFGRN